MVLLVVAAALWLTWDDRASERRAPVSSSAASAAHATAPKIADARDGHGPSRATQSRSDASRAPRVDGQRPGGGHLVSESGGRHTMPIERPPPDPLAFAIERMGAYETTSETNAGRLRHVAGTGGTITFWLRPAWETASGDDATFVRIGDDRVRLYKSATVLRFEVTDSNGQPIAVDVPISGWTPGDWHQLLASWDGRNVPHVISFFVDGNIVGQSEYQGAIALPRRPRLYVGTNAPDRAVAPGTVADVKVQNRPLSLTDVSRWFESSTPPGY